MHDCRLLQDLGIVSVGSRTKPPDPRPVKDYLFNLVKTQLYMGRQTLVKQVNSQFPEVEESKLEELIYQLCQENKIQLLKPNDKPEQQFICLVVPKN